MADATIRLGKISSIDYAAGRARVVYEDRDSSVTGELPFLAWQYHMPKINDLVIVACFSNGTVSGVILGPIWNGANKPYGGEKGEFRQEMCNTKNEAVIRYSEKERILFIRAPHIEFEGYEYKDRPYNTLEQYNDMISDIEEIRTNITSLDDRVRKLEGYHGANW